MRVGRSALLVLGLWSCARPAAAAEPAGLMVDCAAPTRRISPMIYGVGDSGRTRDGEATAWELGATVRRWGGNTTSRYNWEADAWNTGSDWFFHNLEPGSEAKPRWERFLDANREHGVSSALTLPTIGWVAKDRTAVSFPRSRFPRQQAFAEEDPQAGNGIAPGGQPLRADPLATSVAAPPEFVTRWVRELKSRKGAPVLLFLDNEPTLWHETHRDVHPEPVGYDELWDRTLRYARAARAGNPQARIAAPSLWGWPDLFDSGKDAVAGHRLHPDRRAHGDQPLLEWWLDQVRAEESRSGAPLIDVLDVHAYPQADALEIGRKGGTDPKTNALRLRSTRMLWDPTYVDESWIHERVELIPRLKRWIAQHRPGLQLSIGEWNFGAEEHISGGLAVAEVLGRFAEQGLDWAFYWTAPPRGSPAYWAFHAYRNYDGSGKTFGDELLRSSSPEGVSLFASRMSGDGRVVLVVLNLDPARTRTLPLELRGCAVASGARRLTYRGEREGFRAAEWTVGTPVSLPGYSISVIELRGAR